METYRFAGAGVVDRGLDLADAVRPRVELLAHAVGSALARLVELLQQSGRAVGVDEVVQARLADGVANAGLGGEVADHHLRHAAVGPDERRGVPLQPVAAHEAHGRYQQTLAEEVARGGVARARGDSADVGRVADTGGECDEGAVPEDGGHHDHVVGVGAAAVVRVTREESVALTHVGRSVEVEQSVDGRGQPAHVARMGAARDEASGRVHEPAAEVVGLADDGGEAGTEDGVLHLADDAVEAGAHHLEGDDVERGVGHALCTLTPTLSQGETGRSQCGAHDTRYRRERVREPGGFRYTGRWAEAGRPFPPRGAFV